LQKHTHFSKNKMSKKIQYFIDLGIVGGGYPDWKFIRLKQQKNPKLVPWPDPDGNFVYWAESEPTPEDIEFFWTPEAERFELVINPESEALTLPDEIKAANPIGHVYIRDNLLGKVVAMLNPPYSQLICLETTEPDPRGEEYGRDLTGFSKLVVWLNSLSQEALESEGIYIKS